MVMRSSRSHQHSPLGFRRALCRAGLNAYGHSKLAGKRGVRAANSPHVILRTSWLSSPYRKNFVRTILRLAAELDRLQNW